VIELSKGQEIVLPADGGLLRMGLGWDKNPSAGPFSSGTRDVDLDASAVQFGGDQLFDLAHHVFDAARALLTAQLRDHAERAAAIATLGDFHVRAGAARGDGARIRSAHDPVGRIADEHAIARAAQHLLDFEHVAGAEEVIHLGHAFGQLFAIALAQATGDDQLLAAAVFFLIGEREDGVDGLLLGRVDEAASVDDDDFGL